MDSYLAVGSGGLMFGMLVMALEEEIQKVLLYLFGPPADFSGSNGAKRRDYRLNFMYAAAIAAMAVGLRGFLRTAGSESLAQQWLTDAAIVTISYFVALALLNNFLNDRE